MFIRSRNKGPSAALPATLRFGALILGMLLFTSCGSQRSMVKVQENAQIASKQVAWLKDSLKTHAQVDEVEELEVAWWGEPLDSLMNKSSGGYRMVRKRHRKEDEQQQLREEQVTESKMEEQSGQKVMEQKARKKNYLPLMVVLSLGTLIILIRKLIQRGGWQDKA